MGCSYSADHPTSAIHKLRVKGFQKRPCKNSSFSSALVKKSRSNFDFDGTGSPLFSTTRLRKEDPLLNHRPEESISRERAEIANIFMVVQQAKKLQRESL